MTVPKPLLDAARQRRDCLRAADERWFVDGGARDQIGPLDDQIQRDDRAEGIADDMRRAQLPRPSINAARSRTSSRMLPWPREAARSAVTATIVGRDAEAAGQQRNDGVPVVMVAPGTVNEDDRRAGVVARLEVTARLR